MDDAAPIWNVGIEGQLGDTGTEIAVPQGRGSLSGQVGEARTPLREYLNLFNFELPIGL